MCPSRWWFAYGHLGALTGRLYMKFGDPEPRELRVEIREEAGVQQRVVGEVDAGHDVRGTERDLLNGLGEEVVRASGLSTMLAHDLEAESPLRG